MSAKLSAEAALALDKRAFLGHFGGLYEHSPWVVEQTWERGPFDSMEALGRGFDETIRDASLERKLALIRAHPELAGKEADEGSLTTDSVGEQASAGLDRLSAGELATLTGLNRAYAERFGFPMVVAVREHTKDSIFAQARARLDNPRTVEVENAVGEVVKIGRLRLARLVDFDDTGGAPA